MNARRFFVLAVCLATIIGAAAGCSSSSSTGPTPPPAPPAFPSTLPAGSYTFAVSGVSVYTSAPYSFAGVFTVNSAGNITVGEQDYSDSDFWASDSISGGTTAIGTDGRGTVTLETGDTDIGVDGSETLSIVMISPQHLLITEFDASATSSGTVDRQAAVAFTDTTLSGGYAFVMQGWDFDLYPMAWGGVINVDNRDVDSNPLTGGISGTGSVSDLDEGGSVYNAQGLSGTVNSVDSSGRADITLYPEFMGGDSLEVIAYITDAQHVKLVEVDDMLGIAGGLSLGQGTSNGSFTASRFSGTFVFGGLGMSDLPMAAAGLFTAEPTGSSDPTSGEITSGILDISAGSYGQQADDTFSGTYAVDPTGRGIATLTDTANTGYFANVVFYLTADGTPLLLETDEYSLMATVAYPQASGVGHSGSVLSGNYGLNFTNLVLGTDGDGNDTFDWIDATGVMSADGVGALSGKWDINDLELYSDVLTPMPGIAFTGTFTPDSSGRFAGTFNSTPSGPLQIVYYVVDANNIVYIEMDDVGVAAGVFQKQYIQP